MTAPDPFPPNPFAAALDPNPQLDYPPAPYAQPGPYPLMYTQPGPSYPGPAGYPGYQAYPGHPPAAGTGRPGLAMAASVLAFVVAGLLIIAGMLLFFGASIGSSFQDAYNASEGVNNDDPIFIQLYLDATANLIAAGLLIAGGAMLLVRRPTGRVLLSVGGAICAGSGVYWIDRVPSAGVAFWLMLFVIPTAVAVTLAWQRPVSTWLAASQPLATSNGY